VTAELAGDVRRSIWEKFVFLVGLSATTTTTAAPAGRGAREPPQRAFLLEVMREVVRVGRAQGVALPEDFRRPAPRLRDTLPTT
jgi:2-dehydropantoate 2-reductase